MPFIIPLDEAQGRFPEYEFIGALTPSEQKAAFHVQKDAQDFCLKIIAPDYELDRLKREIQALQMLDHQNVVNLIEYVFTSKQGELQHYLIEEYIDGNDLSELIQTNNAWEIVNAIELFSQLFDGLESLREINIVHRDLKPTNIRVRPNGSPVIIDFGLARHLDLSDLTQTEEGAAIGTPKYFAPEQFNGTKYDIDHRTDLFAVGIILYEALIGEHPFLLDGMDYGELRTAVSESDDFVNHPNFVDLPKNLRILVEKLLGKERSMRPNAASQVASILRKIGDVG